MTVEELIKKLEVLPKEAKVFHLWDGEPRTELNVVYESKDGSIITADYEEVCYSDDARPKTGPTVGEKEYWKTEKEK